MLASCSPTRSSPSPAQAGPASAGPHEVDRSDPAPAPNLANITFGTATNAASVELAADGINLLENGRRITPVTGEFHSARYGP